MKKTVVRMAVGFLCMMMPLAGKTALINQLAPYEGNPTDVNLQIQLTNNDPSAIYNSATLNLDALCGTVADIVIARNADYFAFTRNQVMQEWGVSIRTPPTGEVSTGWSRSLDGSGVLNLSHSTDPGVPGFDYTSWLSTSDNSFQDLMAITVSVPKSQLDFNGNSLFDAETEAIFMTTETVADAFVANTGTAADGFKYDVVPEPATLTMLGLAGLLIAAKRRFFG